MVDWKELQKQLSNGERKIEFITDDSSEYKVLRKRALELSDAEAEYWFGLWQEKVNFSSRMAGYYYEKAQKGGVKEASYALNRINGTLDDKTRDVIYQGRQDQSSKKEADVHAAQNVSPIWTIKEHDFNNAKKQIKKFSNEAARDLDIKLVDEKREQENFFVILF